MQVEPVYYNSNYKSISHPISSDTQFVWLEFEGEST
jgi:hypothetical protein